MRYALEKYSALPIVSSWAAVIAVQWRGRFRPSKPDGGGYLMLWNTAYQKWEADTRVHKREVREFMRREAERLERQAENAASTRERNSLLFRARECQMGRFDRAVTYLAKRALVVRTGDEWDAQGQPSQTRLRAQVTLGTE